MSTVELVSLVNGLSGKIGKSVLRRRGSKTFLSSVPKREGLQNLLTAVTQSKVAARFIFAAYNKRMLFS